jgi:hypothetical protein
MKLQFRSRNFIKELERRQSEFGSKKAAARLTVPDGPQHRWWYFQEFGTATHNPDSPHPSGYEIYPVNGGALSWVAKDGTRIVVPFVGFPFTDIHPGVTPKRYIATIEPNLKTVIASRAVSSMLSSKFDFNALNQALLTEIMPEIKRQIVESMAEKLSGTREDGKLAGQTAASVFEQITQIVEV